MSDPTKSRIGYVIAAFGMLVILVTFFLLYRGIITSTDKGILFALILLGACMVGLGMYAVVPKESHDFVNDVGGFARDIVPHIGRSRDGEQAPAVVQPAAGQTTIVQPAGGPAVAVSPEGNVTVATDSAPQAPPADPELATGAALPLVRRAPMPPPAGKATPRAIHRQSLYPPDDA